MSVDFDSLQQLSVAEKVHVITRLWREIHDSEERLLVQDWQLAEAQSRAAELDADPSIALTRDELWKRIDDTGDLLTEPRFLHPIFAADFSGMHSPNFEGKNQR